MTDQQQERDADLSPSTVGQAEVVLLERLRGGDEPAFVEVVQRWSSTMIRVARTHVSTDASAQEVVQDTWLAVVAGLRSFEGRSSIRTWVFGILVNLAKSRGVKESRTIARSSLAAPGDSAAEDVGFDRFQGDDGAYPRHWTSTGAPQRWETDPVGQSLRGEVRLLLETALDALPAQQRNVVVMRDVDGRAAYEVCTILDISAENQRVLLHRGRTKVRGALEHYYRGRA
jgi:RNA polymerase sigma-70 factor (ECF subfamily)